MSFLEELKRRNVIKVGVLYVVTGWLVLQAADVMLPLVGVPDWGMRLVLVILGLGFVPALLASWIWEITPEGIKRESEVDRSASITSHTGRKINVVIVAMLAVAIGLLLYQTLRGPAQTPGDESAVVQASTDRDRHSSPGPAVVPATATANTFEAPDSRPSIAVLPFVNMSADPDNAYFADGLSETLLHVLAQIDDMRVAARTSSFSFKNKEVTVREVGHALGVGTVLEGSVQRSGDRIRIIAQLIDVDDGSHLWSKNFDRTLDDIFAIQDEIATEVVEAMKITLLGEEEDRLVQRQTTNLDAYREYVLGQQEIARRESTAMDRAEAHFKRALEHDPDYVLAYVGLGTAYRLQAEYSDLSRIEAIDLIRPQVEKSLALDPDSGEAYALKGALHNFELDDEKAETAFLKAIELNPNHATAYHWYGVMLRNDARVEESLRVIRKAQELDPLSDVIQLNVVSSLWGMGQVELAAAHLKDQLERNPEFPGYHATMAAIERFGTGNLVEALRWYRSTSERDPGNVNFQDAICDVLIELGDQVRAATCIDAVAAMAGQRLDPLFSRSLLLILQGRNPEALRTIEQIIERAPDNPGGWRFKADILARAGRVDEALETYRRGNPEMFETPVLVDRSNYYQALDAALFLQLAGHSEPAAALLEGVEAVIQVLPRTRGFGYFWADAFLYALRGETDRALDALEEAYGEGVRVNWPYLRVALHLRSLHGHERFQSLMARLESDAATALGLAEREGLL